MGGKLDIYNLGETGVDVVKSPLHEADGDLFKAQNAHADPAGLEGGIRKRDGMAKVNSVAMSGSVLGLIHIPLEDPVGSSTTWIYAGYKGSGAQFFNTGAAYPKWVTNGILLSPGDGGIGLDTANTNNGDGVRQYDTKLAAAFPASTNYRATSGAQNANRIFYAADYYTIDVDAPSIRMFTGTKDVELARIPEWFDAGTRRQAKAIIRLLAYNGFIYVATWDGGTGTNLAGRVFKLDPNSGALTLIGQPFGNQAGEAVGGMPFSLAFWNGRLWAGTANGQAAPVGTLYWIRPGIDATWTGDHATAAGNILCMAGYSGTGNLYLGLDGFGGSGALVLERTPAGVWSTSTTGGDTTTRNRFDVMIEFESALYVHYYAPSAAPAANQQIIRKYDGTSWTTDASIVTIMSAASAPLAETKSGASALVLPDLLMFAFGNAPANGGNLIEKYNGTWKWSGVAAFGGGDTVLGYIKSDATLNAGHL